MYNINILKAEITKRGLNQRKLAAKLGIEAAKLNRKLHTGRWLVEEFNEVMDALDVTDKQTFMQEIFFN